MKPITRLQSFCLDEKTLCRAIGWDINIQDQYNVRANHSLLGLLAPPFQMARF